MLSAFSYWVSAQTTFFDKADSFFKTYVDERGYVAYPIIQANPEELNELVSLIEAAAYPSFSQDEKKAFLINSYNILVIKQVIDLSPINSPLDNSSFFNGIRHQVDGHNLTLDELEKGMFMMEFHDPRAHFVLVCAAKSCPPLANFAYRPDGIDNQLEERTKYVLNLDWFVPVKNNVEFSQIFNWYRADFEKGGKTLVEYINQYREEKLKESKRYKFYEYDWALNIQ